MVLELLVGHSGEELDIFTQEGYPQKQVMDPKTWAFFGTKYSFLKLSKAIIFNYYKKQRRRPLNDNPARHKTQQVLLQSLCTVGCLIELCSRNENKEYKRNGEASLEHLESQN